MFSFVLLDMNQLASFVGPQPFDVKNEDCATEWNNWVRSFEIFAAASGIKIDVKRDWLLHYAGPKVQNIYYNLPEPSGPENGKLPESHPLEGKRSTSTPETETTSNGDGERTLSQDSVEIKNPEIQYKETVTRLSNYFAPKQSKSYERHLFRKLVQRDDERFDPFLIRLRAQADRCEFGDQRDENIKEQITSACNSGSLRRKVLERGDQSLDAVIKLARVLESVTNQQKSFTTKAKSSNNSMDEKNEEVCDIGTRKLFKRKYFNGPDRMECSRCGLKGHKSNDTECSARDKKCSKCDKIGHFARKCFTKGNENIEPRSKLFKREPVRMITGYDDYDDVFCVSTCDDDNNKIWCKVGGVVTEVVVDSGTKRNIVDRESWLELKAKNIITTWRRKEVDIGFTAYGGYSLSFIGMFEASVQAGQKKVMAKFYVANEVGKFLLGYETAKLLGVLKIGIEVNNVNESVRDRDKNKKEEGKKYADTKRHAKPNEIKEGDDVVLKRPKVTNKLSSTFEPTTYTVKNRHGSEIMVENAATGTEYRRNVAHAKKIPHGGFRMPETDEGTATDHNPDATTSDQNERPKPKRSIRTPKRYGFDD